MNKKLYFTLFIAGAVIGSVVTWGCLKKKYEVIAQEEIDSVKEVFSRERFGSREKETVEESGREPDPGKEKTNMDEYAAVIRTAGYSADIQEEKENESVTGRDSYIITPEEFGEMEDYEKISLTWYADRVLADDNDEILDDMDDIVGDALEHFGEYEDDAVFVRCDELECDYEILLDQRNYSEVAASMPKPVEI